MLLTTIIHQSSCLGSKGPKSMDRNRTRNWSSKGDTTLISLLRYHTHLFLVHKRVARSFLVMRSMQCTMVMIHVENGSQCSFWSVSCCSRIHHSHPPSASHPAYSSHPSLFKHKSPRQETPNCSSRMSRDLDALKSREVMVVMKVGIVVMVAALLSERVRL